MCVCVFDNPIYIYNLRKKERKKERKTWVSELVKEKEEKIERGVEFV